MATWVPLNREWVLRRWDSVVRLAVVPLGAEWDSVVLLAVALSVAEGLRVWASAVVLRRWVLRKQAWVAAVASEWELLVEDHLSKWEDSLDHLNSRWDSADHLSSRWDSVDHLSRVKDSVDLLRGDSAFEIQSQPMVAECQPMVCSGQIV